MCGVRLLPDVWRLIFMRGASAARRVELIFMRGASVAGRVELISMCGVRLLPGMKVLARGCRGCSADGKEGDGMKIGGQEVYAGAYDAKCPKPVFEPKAYRLTDQQKKGLVEQMNAAAVKYKLFGEDYDYATISEEGRGFKVSDEIIELGEVIDFGEQLKQETMALNEKLRSEHLGEADELFWGSSGSQWLVFSQKLYDNGFFDDMSAKEAGKIDEVLRSITYVMDGYSCHQYGYSVSLHTKWEGYLDPSTRNGVNYCATSSDALKFALESATAALQYFSEGYIQDEELKKDFNGLIDIFHDHNAQKLEKHMSFEEMMDRARSKHLVSITAALAASRGQYGAGFEDSVALGSVSHTEEEEKGYQASLSLLFGQLKSGTAVLEDVWKKMEDIYTDYAAKGDQKQSVRSLALSRSDGMLDRMHDMWAGLLGQEKRMSALDVRA